MDIISARRVSPGRPPVAWAPACAGVTGEKPVALSPRPCGGGGGGEGRCGKPGDRGDSRLHRGEEWGIFP